MLECEQIPPSGIRIPTIEQSSAAASSTGNCIIKLPLISLRALINLSIKTNSLSSASSLLTCPTFISKLSPNSSPNFSVSAGLILDSIILRKISIKSSKNIFISTPSSINLLISLMQDAPSFLLKKSTKLITSFKSFRGITRSASSCVISFPPIATICPSKLSASRICPPDCRAIISKIDLSTLISSFLII